MAESKSLPARVPWADGRQGEKEGELIETWEKTLVINRRPQ